MFIKVMRDTVIACVVGGFVGYRYFTKLIHGESLFLGTLAGIFVGYSLLKAFDNNKKNRN